MAHTLTWRRSHTSDETNDNVVVARVDILPGAELAGEGLTTSQRIPAGHKVATRPIETGEPVRKFDQIIGFASRPIAPGEHVHVHNCRMGDFARDYAVGEAVRPTDFAAEGPRRSFPGFVRPNGRVGTRNYIGVLSTVNCSASVSKFVAERFPQEELARYPNVDGIVAITHGTGCGMVDAGEGYATLQRTLWGFAAHPNFAAIVMIGLGCEVMQISFMQDVYGIVPGPAFRTMTLQGTGGTRRTIEAAQALIREMLPDANRAARQPVSVGEISLALQCGGSDGYSGITANPALGHCADLLVRQGGTAILSETPEIYGAEHLLTRRAASQAVGEKLIERVRWWEEYTSREGFVIDNNPAPGNKAGGLTTIYEKSLGAVHKITAASSHDGKTIEGWLTLPPGYREGQRVPLILEIHGGPFAAYGGHFSTDNQLYAAAGYAVLSSNPRGSTSYGAAFANEIDKTYPGNDYFDLISIVDRAVELGVADPDALFVTGGSGGGVLTSWIVGKTDKFKAAVAQKPVINWTTQALTADGPGFFGPYWLGAEPWEKPDLFWSRSPLSLVGNVKTPTLVIVGAEDYRTPVSESEQYYTALRLRGVPTALIKVPGASHGGIAARPSQSAAKASAILAWFEKYRKGWTPPAAP